LASKEGFAIRLASGGTAATITDVEVVPVAPPLSVTITEAVQVPAA